MTGGQDRGPRVDLTVAEAAEFLRLPADTVEQLLRAGYLRPAEGTGGAPRLALGDLKGFLARNQIDLGAPAVEEVAGWEEIDPDSLVEALEERTDEMARRTLDVMIAAFPDAGRWPLSQQARFVETARARFEAILTVAGAPGIGDEALAEELVEVGETAEEAGTSLAELLLVLRISRDLIVQTAVEVAEERGRRWGLALSLLLTRILPVLDRLTDAIARGWWAAALARERDIQARFANIVERSSDGIYEIDLDGRIRYANRSLALMLGRKQEELQGRMLTEVVILADPGGTLRLDADEAEIAVRRADGVIRVFDVRTVERRAGDEVVGYDSVVRDVTAARRLEEQRNDFLALVTSEVRQPLTTILGLGITLESYAPELAPERIRAVGASLREQAERISRLADDLFDVSRLEYDSLLLSLRPVDLAATVEAGLGAVEGAVDVTVRVPAGLRAVADRRRLEQVVANLVENAIVHGGPPVLVDAEPLGAEVELVVRDHGPGVDPAIEAGLFSQLWPLTGLPRRSRSDVGLGLSLVRGLVEAMGGRVSYRRADTGGAAFIVRLPSVAPEPEVPGRG